MATNSTISNKNMLAVLDFGHWDTSLTTIVAGLENSSNGLIRRAIQYLLSCSYSMGIEIIRADPKLAELVNTLFPIAPLLQSVDHILYIDMRFPFFSNTDIESLLDTHFRTGADTTIGMTSYGTPPFPLKISRSLSKDQLSESELPVEAGALAVCPLPGSHYLTPVESEKSLYVSQTLSCVSDQTIGQSAKHIDLSTMFLDRIADVFFSEGQPALSEATIRDNPERLEVTRTMLQDGNRSTSNARLLDLGCSDGGLTFMIADLFQSILAVDAVGVSIEKAVRRLNHLKKEREIFIEFLQCDVLALDPQKVGTFDTVLISEVLEHLPWPLQRAFIRKAIDMMHPKANFIATVPNRFPSPDLSKQGRSRWRYIGHLRHFSSLDFTHLLKEFFLDVTLYPSTENYGPDDGIFLMAHCKGIRS